MRGRLVYVIGPSGAGKDSVLRGAREQGTDTNVTFAHRYITRPAEAGGENHIALTTQEFALRLRRGCFALNWSSHGFEYGIGREVDQWMRCGFTVVVNGSRGYLQEALLRYPTLLPVLVTARPEILAERLMARGRETEEQVVLRLQRNALMDIRHPGLVRIENNDRLDSAVSAFCLALAGKTAGDGVGKREWDTTSPRRSNRP